MPNNNPKPLHLPIDDYIPQLVVAYQKNQNLIISAAPGAGKTTRLPSAIAKIAKGKVLVLEPRRMAAVAAAHRVAEECNWIIGRSDGHSEVGYQVRFLNETNHSTKLIFMTEALLTRHLLSNPELHGIECIFLDEFHERSAHVDLALGLIKELQILGSKIKLIIMSATLDAEKMAHFLPDSEIIYIPGKMFEVKIHYQKASQNLQTQSDFYENLKRTVIQAQKNTENDILVFLPGVGEIQRTREQLQTWAKSNEIDLVELHGSLSLEAQRKAIGSSAQQKVILSTNVAESSVTIDGVDTVVDCGLSKTIKLSGGFGKLSLNRISLSSAEQRAGRSARQFPGQCYRMWNQMDELSFPKFDIPEIRRVPLMDYLLWLSGFGIPHFQSFSWYESPDISAIDEAVAALRKLQVLDSYNQLTHLGKRILNLPVSARHGKILIEGERLGQVELACWIVAVLQEKDTLLGKSIGNYIEAYLSHQFECDIVFRIHLLMAESIINKKNIQTIVNQLSKYFKITHKIDYSYVPMLLLAGYSDRLCVRREKSSRGLMVGGRGVKLSTESMVRQSEYFLAIEGLNTDASEVLIGVASGVSKEFLLRNYSHEIVLQCEIIFNNEKMKFYRQEYKELFGLKLDSGSISIASNEEILLKAPEYMVTHLEWVCRNNENFKHLMSRIRFLFFKFKEYPELEESLRLTQIFNESGLKPEILEEAFRQAVYGESDILKVTQKDLTCFLMSQFSMELQKFIEKEIPSHLQVPSGSQILIYYPEGRAPNLEVRIQEIFGWDETPIVFLNKTPLLIHLLAPNRRLVQVTSDLKSFWKSGYLEVRKELRLRYPKHQWPEDPSMGIPEAKGRRHNK